VHARWPFPSFWEIPKEEHQQRLLQNLIGIFAAEQRTDFQQRLFDASLIYSQNNVAKEPYAKLIFCLVAVESMLVKDPSEPIQDNIGERMAYPAYQEKFKTNPAPEVCGAPLLRTPPA
jgi:hypothetical protein